MLGLGLGIVRSFFLKKQYVVIDIESGLGERHKVGVRVTEWLGRTELGLGLATGELGLVHLLRNHPRVSTPPGSSPRVTANVRCTVRAS